MANRRKTLSLILSFPPHSFHTAPLSVRLTIHSPNTQQTSGAVHLHNPNPRFCCFFTSWSKYYIIILTQPMLHVAPFLTKVANSYHSPEIATFLRHWLPSVLDSSKTPQLFKLTHSNSVPSTRSSHIDLF